ncbi:MAG: PPC domain-containing protein [Chloroflexota bacterium]
MLKTLSKAILRLTLGLLVLSSLSVALAQQTDDRALVPQEPVTGTLDAEAPAQIYLFNVASGDSVTLLLNTAEDFSATLVLSDSRGESLAQVQSVNGIATISDLAIARGDTYYVTVFPSPGTTVDTPTTFTLTLEQTGTVSVTEDPTATESPPAEATAAAQPISAETFDITQVVLTGGIQVDLTWNTDDDLNLQIRDPSGGTLFWDSRSTNDGGTFGPDVNGLCEVISTPPNVETAAWPGGTLTTGSYEVLVYYRQACDTPAPVDFTVDITVDGTSLQPISGTIEPPQNNIATVYLGSFTISPDGTASVGAQGPYTDTRVLPMTTEELIAEPAVPIEIDTPVEGVITNDQYYETYAFEAEAGQTVSIEMTATEGNLDTLLLVLNSSGAIIADNDDIVVVENTNSAIEGLRLPTTDTYTIYASRYGKNVGGTEGVYQLLISQSSVPQQLVDLNLPTGDIEVTLTWNTNADLQLLVRDPFGVAVYDDDRSIQSGGTLTETGNINCTVSEGPPVYHIYWPDGTLRIGSYEVEVWYQSECGDTRPVSFTLFIVVNGELLYTTTTSITFNERYLTSFNIDQGGEAASSDGGIIGGSETLPYQEELASAIAISDGDTLTGSITANNKFDLYVFEGRVNDVISIRMNATSQTLDTQLFLIDPNGAEIATNDDANGDTTNSLINNITLTQDGTYTIIATHYGAIFGGTTGGYNLSLDVQRSGDN